MRTIERWSHAIDICRNFRFLEFPGSLTPPFLGVPNDTDRLARCCHAPPSE